MADEGLPASSDAASAIVVSVSPPTIDFSLHARNRAAVVDNLKRFGGATVPEKAVILVQGGVAETRDDTDHEPLFRQESNFHYLFGVREPDCFGAIDVATGAATLFIPRLPDVYATWMGDILPPAHFQAAYGVDTVLFVDELDAALTAMAPTVLYTLRGLNSDSGNYAKEAAFDGIEKHRVDNGLLYEAVVEARVIKSADELALLRYVNAVTCDAHMAVMAHCRPGLLEYQLESLFRHWCYYHGGARNMSYTCICGTGKNGATLHYGHAGAPNDKRVEDGDMCLFDMGCEYHCYASDVTCSFPANGVFTKDQRLIYEAVLAAQRAVLDALKPGVKWTDMHALAYETALTALRDGGLLVGDVDEMMRANLGAVLMPHGLGHFMGIDTHDCGGYPRGAARDPRDGFKSLRTVREVRAGMVLTVEPGIYFIDHLLKGAMADADKARFFDAAVLARFWVEGGKSFGGVRLEDDVIVTEDGCENMTIAPRTVEEVEAVCAGRVVERLAIAAYKARADAPVYGGALELAAAARKSKK
uniref:Xaa-Pro dipeptidase n=1 Tax=Bicosoecida sp. CB-2014 TaxID=1486930 RepID=A0A7S1CA66_9STRA